MYSLPVPAVTLASPPACSAPTTRELQTEQRAVAAAARSDSKYRTAGCRLPICRVFLAHPGNTRSILRQSFWAAAHFAVQSGAWFS